MTCYVCSALLCSALLRSGCWGLNLICKELTQTQTTTNFGLIDRSYDTDAEYDPRNEKTQWQRFEHKVFRLNRDSGRNVHYKVLYMGRHGEGHHNVAEAFYGTPAWDVSIVTEFTYKS